MVEQVANVGSGFIVSLIYWTFVIIPQLEYWGELTFERNLIITLQFTVISVVRGLVWRRLFNYFMVKNYQRRSV